MSHRRTWGVVGLDGQQHLQVRLLAQCGDNIYVLYEYDMTYLLIIYWLLLVDAAAGTLSVLASSKDPQARRTYWVHTPRAPKVCPEA